MESKVGSILLMISGVITLLIALGVILLSILVFTGVMKGEGNAVFGGVVFLIIGILALIISFLKFWTSGLMKNPATTTKGGIIALVIGILSSDVLALVGGILGIVQGGK